MRYRRKPWNEFWNEFIKGVDWIDPEGWRWHLAQVEGACYGQCGLFDVPPHPRPIPPKKKLCMSKGTKCMVFL